MNIQWFPGHMAKAVRSTEENIKAVDAVIYVLDSRAPKGCINPRFARIIKDKPILYVLNKADLGDQKLVDSWIKYLSQDNSKAVAITATNSNDFQRLMNAIKDMAFARQVKWQSKGLNYTPRAMVIGIPNSGKSTVINLLCKKARTATGDRPGVTRGKQWVKVGDAIELLDTPGVLPPKFDDELIARHVAYIGSIKDEILDIYTLARFFVEEITILYPNAIKNRYNIETENCDGDEILNRIAKARGFLLKGAELDLDRCAAAVLEDFRSGRLGRITLEKPLQENA